MAKRLGREHPGTIPSTHQGPFRPFGPHPSRRTEPLPAIGDVSPHVNEPVTVVTDDSLSTEFGVYFVIQPDSTINAQYVFYGAGADNAWIEAMAFGEKELIYPTKSGATSEWLPRPLVHLKMQLGGKTAPAGMSIPSGARMVDNIAIIADYTPGASAKVVNAEGGLSTLVFDHVGNEKIRWDLVNIVPSGETGTGATNSNGAWAGL